jgi:hypothetical protein
MNKLTVGLLLAAGFFFADVTPVAAHQGADHGRMYNHGYQFEARRHEMPVWLKRNKHFRHWYRHSPLRHYRQIRWNKLFEIYRWERRYFGSRHYVDYDDDRRRHGERRRYRHDD